jgi:cell division protein FtsB
MVAREHGDGEAEDTPPRGQGSRVQGSNSRAARGGKRRRRAHPLFGLSSTRRAAVLTLVVCALALSVAVPLRNYLSQRGELRDTVQQQQQLRQQVDELERRKAQLSDPAQVEVEARERLRYVKPGETPYVVQLPSQTTTTPPPADPANPDEPRAAGGDQWYGQLWRTIAQEPDQ